MHPQIETIFDEAENRYLKPEEVAVLSQYITSLPARLATYRALRDNELTVMQAVADQLVAAMPQEKTEKVERSIKNCLLALRYCAMGTLLNDEKFVRNRLGGWLEQTSQVYDSQAIDAALYRLLTQELGRVLKPEQVALLRPMLAIVQEVLQIKEPQAAGLGW